MRNSLPRKTSFFTPLLSLPAIAVVCLGVVVGSDARAETHRIAPDDSDGLRTTLATAANGDTILLGGGTYRGNFEVHQSLKLLGSDDEDSPAVLTSEGTGSVLRVFASEVEISQLGLRHSGTDISAKDACVYVEPSAHHVRILNNQMNECTWGVWIHEASHALVEGNSVRGTTKAILSDRGNGIHLFNTKETQVRGNRIQQGRDGLYISNSENVILENNHMDQTRFGIHYMYSHRCKVIGNTALNSQVGAAIMYSKELVIRGNHFENNSDHGILFRDVLYSAIEDNRSQYNYDGIFLGGSLFNTIRGNTFERNKLAAHVSAGSKDNEVFDNNFIDNQLQVRFLDRKSIQWNADGRGNYWSHYAGWDRDHNGIGDTRFLVTRISDKLTHSFPVLKSILGTPAMQLLRKIENQFPVISGPVIIDEYPLMRPATS